MIQTLFEGDSIMIHIWFKLNMKVVQNSKKSFSKCDSNYLLNQTWFEGDSNVMQRRFKHESKVIQIRFKSDTKVIFEVMFKLW